MMLRNFFVFAALAASFTSLSQTPEKNLFNWSQLNPIEKVYLHTDREAYTAGQTIWFKAYFLSEYIPSGKSTSLTVELLNAGGEMIQRKVFPAFLGESFGQIELSENLVTGTYHLRAFSPLVLNQPGFFFNKKLEVFGKEAKQPAKKPVPARTDITFFPEGGNLITSLMNNIAFKAVDENGLPVDITLEIRNNKDELISQTSSVHDGMGSFALVPLAGETYYGVVPHQTGSVKYPLPEATARGVILNVRNTNNGKAFKVEQLAGNDTFKAAYMIGQMQNMVVFQQNFSDNRNLFGGAIQTTDLLSGILHITVFNKDGMPLAERLTFVNNREYVLPSTFTADSLNTGERKRNRFTIALPDTIIGNFSVSVTDADYETSEMRPQNIYSYFLLNSDLKGYVHNPSWYFSDDPKAPAGLDLVMMTNGWTRFKWEDAVKNTLPKPLYKDNGLISIKGRVTIEGTRRPLANQELIYILSPRDTAMRKRSAVRFLKTDSTGRFAIDSQMFFDRMNILFSEIRGRKNKFIKVKLDEDSLYRRFNLPDVKIPFKDSISEASTAKMNDAYNDYLKAEGLMLGNVTVRGRIKSKIEELEEQYTSGLFSGGINSRVLDLTGENTGSLNIFEYLQGRMPGLTINRNMEGGYNLSYRDGGLGGNNVSLYLDEVQTDASFIESIPVNQIAFVKMMGNFVGTFGGGAALAIYMKKGAELNAATESATDIVPYNGYAIIKEFYNPDYDVRQPDDSKADTRLTLLWNPSMNLAHVDPKIPIIFYNNDRTKKFKIVAEGVTNDGRFLMIEKIVNP